MFCFAKFCRICLNNNKVLVNIYRNDSDNVDFCEKLQFLRSDLISANDTMPAWLCTDCQSQLHQSYTFLKQCIKSHNVLTKYSHQLTSTSGTPTVLSDLKVKLIKMRLKTKPDQSKFTSYSTYAPVTGLKVQMRLNMVSNDTKTNNTMNCHSFNEFIAQNRQKSVPSDSLIDNTNDCQPISDLLMQNKQKTTPSDTTSDSMRLKRLGEAEINIKSDTTVDCQEISGLRVQHHLKTTLRDTNSVSMRLNRLSEIEMMNLPSDTRISDLNVQNKLKTTTPNDTTNDSLRLKRLTEVEMNMSDMKPVPGHTEDEFISETCINSFVDFVNQDSHDSVSIISPNGFFESICTTERPFTSFSNSTEEELEQTCKILKSNLSNSFLKTIMGEYSKQYDLEQIDKISDEEVLTIFEDDSREILDSTNIDYMDTEDNQTYPQHSSKTYDHNLPPLLQMNNPLIHNYEINKSASSDIDHLPTTNYIHSTCASLPYDSANCSGTNRPLTSPTSLTSLSFEVILPESSNNTNLPTPSYVPETNNASDMNVIIPPYTSIANCLDINSRHLSSEVTPSCTTINSPIISLDIRNCGSSSLEQTKDSSTLTCAFNSTNGLVSADIPDVYITRTEFENRDDLNLYLHNDDLPNMDDVEIRYSKRDAFCRVLTDMESASRHTKTQVQFTVTTKTQVITYVIDKSLDLYKCQYCDVWYKGLKDLLVHGKKHKMDVDFVENCYEAPDPKALGQFVMFTVNHKQKLYKCNPCNKKYCDSKSLYRHVACHVSNKQFPCDICGKIFRIYRYLAIHKNNHKKQRIFKCGDCNKTFKAKESLRIHELQNHQQLKPFSCDICGKKFAVIQYFKMHTKRHKKEAGRVCYICGKVLKNEPLCYKHINEKHGQQNDQIRGHSKNNVHYCSLYLHESPALRDSQKLQSDDCNTEVSVNKDLGDCTSLKNEEHKDAKCNSLSTLRELQIGEQYCNLIEQSANKVVLKDTLHKDDISKDLNGDIRKTLQGESCISNDVCKNLQRDMSKDLKNGLCQSFIDGYCKNNEIRMNLKDDPCKDVKNNVCNSSNDVYCKNNEACKDLKDDTCRELKNHVCNSLKERCCKNKNCNDLKSAICNNLTDTFCKNNDGYKDLNDEICKDIKDHVCKNFKDCFSKNNKVCKDLKDEICKDLKKGDCKSFKDGYCKNNEDCKDQMCEDVKSEDCKNLQDEFCKDLKEYNKSRNHCGKCGKLLSTSRKLHICENMDQNCKPVENISSRKVFKGQCDICGKSFPTSRILKLHLIKNSDQCCRIKTRQGFENHVDVRDPLFPTARDVQLHTLKKDICKDLKNQYDICCKTVSHNVNTTELSNESILNSRVYKNEEQHAGKNKNQCEVCGKSFPASRNLQMHMTLHGDKKFKCQYCSKEFYYKRVLSDHLLIHTGEKPHECSHCGKRFRMLGTLYKHVRIHTGEKPFICEVCKRGFAQMSSLQVHMRIHTGEKPYGCANCGKSYAQSYIYRQHVKKCQAM